LVYTRQYDDRLCVPSSIWILGDDMKFDKLVLSQYGWDFDLSDQDIEVRRLMPNKRMCLGFEIVLTKNQIASIKKDMQEKYLKEDYEKGVKALGQGLFHISHQEGEALGLE